MHIVCCTIIVTVRPIKSHTPMLEFHEPPPNDRQYHRSKRWSVTDRHHMAGDVNTQNCLMDAQMIYNEITNLCFHSN
jgi:hypothetical protein